MYIYTFIWKQKSVFLIMYNSQRQNKSCIGTLLTWSTHFPITFKYFLISLCNVKC